ncbi:MAG: DEAD/DEAH box helicase [Candidatus Eisenbacteria bacterium]|nr:DEAD/DEAH box helicase [Candidatus Eisenbacteria bacterium]
MTHDSSNHQESPPAEIGLKDLPEVLRRAAESQGWTALTPVQAKTIPYIRAGRDVMVQSRTGTGKTAAFLLPILERIDADRAECQALVLVPTRELARQVTADAEALATETRVRTVPLYGGVGYGQQLDGLRKGAHLVVGTPGRILDHLLRGSLVLDRLRILVFDEADRMLSMGFYPDMRALQAYLPERRDGFMFSATYPSVVRSLAGQFLREPAFLSLSRDREYVAETEHVYYETPGMEKDRALVRIIEIENPASALIFCNTRANVAYVSKVLQRFGYDADDLSADLVQKERDKVLERARSGKLRFLVATDVAARGIDIVDLSHVFLYDFPEDHESYIHRAGRTGRAGAGGAAISLVDVLEKMELKAVAKQYGIDMLRRELPTDEDVRAIVSERVTAQLEMELRGLDKLVRERMERMIPLARRLGETDDELAVVAMLIDEFYQRTLHAPLEIPREKGEAPEPKREPSRGGGSGRERSSSRSSRSGGGRSRGGRGRKRKG